MFLKKELKTMDTKMLVTTKLLNNCLFVQRKTVTSELKFIEKLFSIPDNIVYCLIIIKMYLKMFVH